MLFMWDLHSGAKYLQGAVWDVLKPVECRNSLGAWAGLLNYLSSLQPSIQVQTPVVESSG